MLESVIVVKKTSTRLRKFVYVFYWSIDTFALFPDISFRKSGRGGCKRVKNNMWPPLPKTERRTFATKFQNFFASFALVVFNRNPSRSVSKWVRKSFNVVFNILLGPTLPMLLIALLEVKPSYKRNRAVTHINIIRGTSPDRYADQAPESASRPLKSPSRVPVS